ncbi:uncharacterized protein LOC135370752 isoform X2 [Ornithodoros turicata]|uniref:uncharacterized protein LOC135370752 isoform X2 n=1 Tax=Ornithodoros turicata TaxID=34597 RepID=UPI0031399F6E
MEFLLLSILICHLGRTFSGVSAIEVVPVKETDPRSTMHIWRPISVFFVGHQQFRPLQDTVVAAGNMTAFYLYAQSILNILAFKYKRHLGCDIKLKTSGTHVVSDLEALRYVPQGQPELDPDSNGGSSVDWTQLQSLRHIVENNTAARAADIIVVMIPSNILPDGIGDNGAHRNPDARMCSADKIIVFQDIPYSYALLYDLQYEFINMMLPTFYSWDEKMSCGKLREFYKAALTGTNEQQCYNTMDTCCIPSFFGIFNLRRAPYCIQNMRAFSHEWNEWDPRCTTACWGIEGLFRFGFTTPTGWVKNQSAEYWTQSLACPRPDDEICPGVRAGPGHGLTYKKFQRTLSYIWELDDYEAPDTDPAFCKNQMK